MVNRKLESLTGQGREEVRTLDGVNGSQVGTIEERQGRREKEGHHDAGWIINSWLTEASPEDTHGTEKDSVGKY